MFLNLIYLFLCMHSGIAIASLSSSNALVVYDPIIARRNSSSADSLAFILNGQPVVGRTTGLEQVVSASSTACHEEHSSSAASSAELLRKKKVQDGLVLGKRKRPGSQESASSAGAGAGGASSSLSYSDIPLACSGRYGPDERSYLTRLPNLPEEFKDFLDQPGYEFLLALLHYTNSLKNIRFDGKKDSLLSAEQSLKLASFRLNFDRAANSLDTENFSMQDLLQIFIKMANSCGIHDIPHGYLQEPLGITIPYPLGENTQATDDPAAKLKADILLLLAAFKFKKCPNKSSDQVSKQMYRKIDVVSCLLRKVIENCSDPNYRILNRLLSDYFYKQKIKQFIPVDVWVAAWGKVFNNRNYELEILGAIKK